MVMFQESQSSIFWFQLVWGQHAVNFVYLVGVLVSAKQLKNVHQSLLSMLFREELKIL